LNEVIKVLDADAIANHCQSYTGILDTCIHTGDCGIRPVILGLHEIVNEALAHITLAQLVGEEAQVNETFHQIQKLERKVANQILRS
jgi:DNA-binding IscR family transcriptional regulator